MHPMEIRGRYGKGGGLIGLFLLVLLVAAAYVGGEWYVTQHVKTGLSEVLQRDTQQEVVVESVGMDGWLFSGRRSGDAVVVVPSDERVAVEFTMIGNPLTGSTIKVEGDERLKLKLREIFGDFF
ncbi:MAG: hypothetical protein EA347_05460 [Thioalkalivibrio sp.]|nr:MAG: hypothetical protein EA347_05460 [Thioalkalivibrio sp.]